MKEYDYGATLCEKLEKNYDGIAVKIADKATLGLPDILFVSKGQATFIETKIGKRFSLVDDIIEINPWLCINDLRQYEHCRKLSRHAMVLYAIYYPEIKFTVVMSVSILSNYRPKENEPIHFIDNTGPHMEKGHGLGIIGSYIAEYRSKVNDIL